MRLALALLLCAACAPVRFAEPVPVAPSLAFTNVNVVDVESGRVLPNQTVLIAGNRIQSVGPSARVRVPEGARVMDAPGGYLIPGLWDMHAHLFNNSSRPGTDNHALYFPLFVASGVTGIRDMWTDLTDLQLVRLWRREAVAGRLLAPRIVGTGTMLDGPAPLLRNVIVLSSPAEARRAVDSLAAGGAEAIKIHDKLPREVYFAIAERARARQLPLVGHVGQIRAAEAAAAGQRSIEHLRGIPDGCSAAEAQVMTLRSDVALPRPEGGLQQLLIDTYSDSTCQELGRRLARSGVWQVPTLTETRQRLVQADSIQIGNPDLRYVDRAEREEWSRAYDEVVRRTSATVADTRRRFFDHSLRLVGAMHRAGVPLLAGTDVSNPFVVAGFSLHEELTLLVEAGLSLLEALQSATINPARYLEATDSLGTVEPGKLADLVLLDANPLEDIRNTQRIRAVVANGRYLDRQALDALLAEAERAAAAAVKD